MAKEDNSSEYKFGVEDLADKLGIEPASARIKLRQSNVKKAPSGRYGWKTKDELASVAEKLKAAKPAAKKADVKSAGKGAAAKDAKTGKGEKVGSAKPAKDAKAGGKDPGAKSKVK